MRTSVTRACGLAVVVFTFGIDVSTFAQSAQGTSQPVVTNAPPARRLSSDEAVKLAIENNLGIQVARIDPQIEDLNVLGARAGWSPSFTSTFQSSSSDAPNQNFLAGAQGGKTSNDQFTSNVGVQQTFRWGGTYQLGWDSSRLMTNNSFSTFSPQIRSSLALNYTQPLLRGFLIDSVRQQVELGSKNREIADVSLRQTIATTTRTVRNAYWDLAYAIASLRVQQESLALAQESLRNTRARVEIGTTPPIDIVEAESEVAARQEAVIVAEAQIGTAEDTLRTLVFDPSMPDFWAIRLEPSDPPALQPRVVDLDGAVRNALDRRTDLEQVRKSLEADDINIKFYRNETLPDVTASIDYGLQGLGGTQLQRGLGPFGPGTGAVVGETQRAFSTVLSDLFTNQFPSWTAGVNISYPLGTSTAEANLARVRLQQSQSRTALRNQQLQVTTEVRQAARQVQTNQQRVESSRVSQQLFERRLEAEQRKFEAGTSTSFLVFQAQRDLSQARNNYLQNLLDYIRSTIDLDAVQEVPLR